MTDPALDEFLGTPTVPALRRAGKWVVIAVLLVLLALLLVRCFGSKPQAGYATAPIQRGDLTVSVAATGNLAPTKQVNVGSEQSGLIDKVFFQNNDRVRQGQPLAQLDLSKLRDALVQSQAALTAAEATVTQNQATVAQTKATLARYEEVRKLSGGKVPAETELDTARADYARAIANVAAARAQVAQARAAVSTNQTNLSKGTIYAPVTGVVLSRQVEPGQTVAASFNVATLFTIAEDLSRMKLEVKVDEADVGDVHAGEQANFTVDAYPGRTFPATVTRVDLGANATPQVNSAGTTTTSTSTVIAYTAVLSVGNDDLLLKPGMTATADIVTARKQAVLLVPNAALRWSPRDDAAAGKGGGIASVLVPQRPGRRGGGGRGGGFGGGGQQQKVKQTFVEGSKGRVFVADSEGQPKRVSVTIGATNGTLTEVSGPEVRAGMKVITGRLAAAAGAGS